MIRNVKIRKFLAPEVQCGREMLSLLVASSPLRFAAIEDSQRNMVKGRAWTKAEDVACIKAFVIVSEDAEKGVNQKRADFMNAVFTVFRKFGVENHPEEYNILGLWPSRCTQSVFQRYKRLPQI
jgi:hypothetical protein